MKTYLDLTEIARIEESATSLRDRLLVRLLFHLGCRISEALALTVQDIDFSAGTVTIQHLKTRSRLNCTRCGARLGRSHGYCPKCGVKIESAVVQQKEHRRVRTLPVDADTLQMLDDYISRGGPVLKNGKRLLFPINRHRSWQVVVECSTKAGLPKLTNPETGKVHNVSPHRLRDAFAVHAVKHDDSGDGLRLLQEHLGHQSFNTTARYRKISGEEHREWYQKLWDKSKS